MPTALELKQKAEKLKREAARLTSEASRMQRSEDTQRKILLGAAALNLCEKDDGFKMIFMSHVDQYFKNEKPRAVLGLPPLKKEE